MKKLFHLTLIALMGISVSAYAQDKPKQKYVIAKGTKMFTGRINAGYSSANSYRSINFGIGEQNGFFVTNNFSIGSIVNYDFRYTREFLYVGPGPGGSKEKRVQMSHLPAVGVALRYYKMFTPRFGFFAEFAPTVGVNIATTKVYGPFEGSSTSHNINLDVSVTPNLVFFVTDKFALEAGFGRLGYAHTFGGATHSANLGITPRLNVGMSFYLGKGVQPKS